MGHAQRLIIPGNPHHVVHKGNKGNAVFRHDDDFKTYLSLLRHYSQIYSCSILSYCLMTNHVHLVVVPSKPESLINLIRDTHQRHSKIFNRKYNSSGHNWQNRYYSCPCDEFHSIAAICYVELNPVRASIVSHAWDYPWSSAGFHAGFINNHHSDLLDRSWLKNRFTTAEWIEFLLIEANHDEPEEIKRHTLQGVPLGGSQFIKSVELEYGKVPILRSNGRPRK